MKRRSLHVTDELPTTLEDGRGAHVAARARVLVVEDDPLIQKMVVRILNKLGYDTDVASDGREAVAAHARRSFDAILMDCQMPEMDGFEATKAIRAAELARGRHTPILALTAMLGSRARCIEAGMDDHLMKPVRPVDLAAAIEKAISLPNTAPPKSPPPRA